LTGLDAWVEEENGEQMPDRGLMDATMDRAERAKEQQRRAQHANAQPAASLKAKAERAKEAAAAARLGGSGG
jgi:hypothetical protein